MDYLIGLLFYCNRYVFRFRGVNVIFLRCVIVGRLFRFIVIFLFVLIEIIYGLLGFFVEDKCWKLKRMVVG